MKFSLNWLKEFVDIEISAEELAVKLTNAGFEVESIEHLGKDLCNVITGKIVKIEKHPNADKLQITQISDGEKQYQIVTGAANVFEGAIVPASLPGAVLAGGFKIQKAVLRGVDSYGMLCSEKELGLAHDAVGIWILPPDTPVGVDVVKHFQLQDSILDLSISPNRGDAQSILGLAREISVILNKELKLPKIKLNEVSGNANWQIKLDAPELCPKYTARFISNAQIKPSPFWLQLRLKVCGIRPINNVVDITNYVLLEYGQPLHAFDAAFLTSKQIVIREAKENEKIITLDLETRTLKSPNLLICDGEKPVALGGVMGGQNSEIKENTKDILLEAAFFEPGNIRRTELDLDLRTESSIRFEKGIDFENVENASNRAAYLMQELAGAQVQKGLFSQVKTDSKYHVEKKIDFNIAKLNKVLGAEYTEKEIIPVLTQLGFTFNSDKTVISVPSWRKNDITELPCLAEEIGRMLGYQRIPSLLPEKSVLVKAKTKLEQIVEIAENFMLGQGYMEVKTFPLIAPQDFEKIAIPKTSLKLVNALSQDESVMRTHLLPSLLKRLEYNYKRQEKDLKIFEIGKEFIDSIPEHTENLTLGALVTGVLNPNAYEPKEKEKNSVDFGYLKGLVQNLLKQISSGQITFKNEEIAYLNPAQTLAIYLADQKIGEFGFLHPLTAQKYDLTESIGYLKINLTLLSQTKSARPKYKVFSKFPHTRRDIALLASKNLSYQEITKIIEEQKPELVTEYFLFDCFESAQIGADKKSLAFAFIYQDQNKTLSDQSVNALHENFSKKLKELLAVEIR